eukprot:788130-Prorocentrum_minimum.AAC.1
MQRGSLDKSRASLDIFDPSPAPSLRAPPLSAFSPGATAADESATLDIFANDGLDPDHGLDGIYERSGSAPGPTKEGHRRAPRQSYPAAVPPSSHPRKKPSPAAGNSRVQNWAGGADGSASAESSDSGGATRESSLRPAIVPVPPKQPSSEIPNPNHARAARLASPLFLSRKDLLASQRGSLEGSRPPQQLPRQNPPALNVDNLMIPTPPSRESSPSMSPLPPPVPKGADQQAFPRTKVISPVATTWVATASSSSSSASHTPSPRAGSRLAGLSPAEPPHGGGSALRPSAPAPSNNTAVPTTTTQESGDASALLWTGDGEDDELWEWAGPEGMSQDTV